MKILFIHLSDIHFSDNASYDEENVNGIVAALQSSIRHVTSVFVLISGDIAFSGTKKQYDQAELFLSDLKKEICKRYKIKDIIFLMVPGNHDVNYLIGVKDLKASGLKQICDDNSFEDHIGGELEKQRAYYSFAGKYECFRDKKTLVDIKRYEFEGKTIQINLINTAVFSSLDEDQGYHFLPDNALQAISQNNDSDYVMSVLHHPHHWYCNGMKKDFEKVIYERNDIIVLGHEHYSSEYRVETKNSAVNICAGGQLANYGCWGNSKFSVYILNLETREFTSQEYNWVERDKIYCEVGTSSRKLAKNRLNSLNVAPTEKYISEIMRDVRYAISSDIRDYFVFPRLEEEEGFNKNTNGKTINDMDSFLAEVLDRKKLFISAHSDNGKSTLAKQVFKVLSQNKVCILLDGTSIRKGNPESFIRCAFEEIYQKESTMYEKFKQLPIEEKALIIDDVDLIPDNVVKDFLDYADNNFDIIIQTSRRDIELDIRERLKKKNRDKDYCFYKICSFYSDKRNQLVSKLVRLLIPNDEEIQNRTELMLCEALSKRKGLISWKPDFIVQFTKYYCNNIGESIQNDGDVFSKVFEANLTGMIRPNLKGMSPDKAFVILDKIAYSTHVNKEDPIKVSRINSVIEDYNEKYGSTISSVDFIVLLTDSGILKKRGNDYRFAQRNYLAYFVAREIRRKFQEEDDLTEFKKALEFACFGINADIILFVTYITDSIKLINMIMELTMKYTNPWEEFSVNPIGISYLAETDLLRAYSDSKLDLVDNTKREVEQEKETELQQEYSDKELVYNYDENKVNLFDELVRGISLMTIISRVLPNFEHIMPLDIKTKCVELIYTLPLKVFDVWAKTLDTNKVELINELKNIDDYTYRNSKLFNSDEDVLDFLRWESTSLLLDLMSVSIRGATKENTYSFLDGFDYDCNNLYRIEHLMELTKKDAETQFAEEAINLFMDAKDSFTKLLVERIARNYIITSKKMQTPTLQRINSKVFNDKLSLSEIWFKRTKKKREN